jgi:ABC-type lipoprotein release transport system permease subunit
MFIYMVVAFLGAFIISNIMMMVVMERRKEIGILKSMGMTRREILFLFLSEGALLGFTGSACGTLLGWILVLVLGHIGIDLTRMLESMKMPIDNIIYPHVELVNVVGSLFLGTIIAALVSLLPSRKAASMNAIEAIRSV